MMRFGPDTGPMVAFALPLFEEANRTRVVAVAMMRALAGHGIASVLPDLPGQGESLVPTEAATLSDLREAFAAAVEAVGAEGRAVYVAAIRSGAVLDVLAPAHGRWHWSPQDGAALLRELTRITQQEVGRERKVREHGHRDGEATSDTPVPIAGNLIAPPLLDALASAMPYDGPDRRKRIVRLDGDPRTADRHIVGIPPWRRAEPASDHVLAQALATDISQWIASCDAQ